MTNGKTIPYTMQTFVGKMMSLLSNMLSRFFITFLPRKIKASSSVLSFDHSQLKIICVPKRHFGVVTHRPSLRSSTRDPEAG